MRIIDKNTDFYDYVQSIYPDKDNVFDRTNSFNVTKKMICVCLSRHRGQFLLLRIGATNWLFFVKRVLGEEEFPYPPSVVDFSAELLTEWKNYDQPLKLIELILFTPSFNLSNYLTNNSFYDRWDDSQYDLEKVKKRVPDLQIAVDNDDVDRKINFLSVLSSGSHNDTKDIPILRGSGLAPLLDPERVFLAFDEYFSLQKQAQERTASIGITDKEKVINHGFDAKTSFRGKNKEKK